MKYIILQDEHGNEYPVLFPDIFVHRAVADLLSHHPGPEGLRPIAAGFLASMNIELVGADRGRCSGESESLKMNSREAMDDILIQASDYAKTLPAAIVALQAVIQATLAAKLHPKGD